MSNTKKITSINGSSLFCWKIKKEMEVLGSNESKRILSIVLTAILFLTVNIYQISFAENGSDLPPKEEQVEKYMGLLRYVSYSENNNRMCYGYLSEQEEQIELGKSVSF